MSTSRLLELASIISDKTKEVDTYIHDNGLPPPSFDPSYPPVLDLQGDVGAARAAALEAIEELKAHLLGPVGKIYEDAVHFVSLAPTHSITRFGMAKAFPADSTITVSDLAQRCRIHSEDAGRILRYATLSGLFREPSPGIIAHTASSQAIANVPYFSAWMENVLTNMWPGASRLVDAMGKWPGSQEPTETAFQLAESNERTFFEALASDEKRAKTFADGMTFFHDAPPFRPEFAIDGYDWSSHASGTVVDVGGSHGVIAFKLAERYPGMSIVVQDRPEVIESAPKNGPSNVEFRAHDFFAEQPVKGADVYFFRWILHDWSDKYCKLILKALIPALKKGAKVVLMEHVLPPPGAIPRHDEWIIRSFDMCMKVLFNAGERSEEDWKKLVSGADENFRVVDVRQPEGSQLGIVVVQWDG